MELRCPGNKVHGVLVDQDDVKASGVIEFPCKSRWCGFEPGTVVKHRFNLATGEIHTRCFKEPPTPRKE